MKELKLDIESYLQESIDEQWDEFSTHLSIKSASKREIILRQTEVCDKVIYLLEGIAASEYSKGDKFIISRFFQSGDFCTNMESAVSKTIESDSVFGITDLKYVEMPYDYFMDLYLHSAKIGVFLRKKILEHLIEAKNIVSVKTTANTEVQYSFLEENHPELIAKTPSKYIAAFIGITPEALSRFLKQRYSS